MNRAGVALTLGRVLDERVSVVRVAERTYVRYPVVMVAAVDTSTGFGVLTADLVLFDDAELTDRFRELELSQRKVAAEMAAITGEVERRGIYRHDGHRSIAGWLRAHGNYAGGSVSRFRRMARLVTDLSEVGDHLYSGRIGVDQAAELGRVRNNPRCGPQLDSVVASLLDHAHRFSFDDFRMCVRRWEILADLDGAHRDRGDAITARRAAVVADTNGVDIFASGGTVLEAAEMAAILDAYADAEYHRDRSEAQEGSAPGAPCPVGELLRTAAQRRFDALLAIFRTANNHIINGDTTPAKVTLNVIVDQYNFETVLARHHLADDPLDLAPPDPSRSHCETSAGIPILPDDTILAALGGWVRRVVVDSAGVVVDMGRRVRCFTGAAAQAARLLATHCETDGCDIPERWSQIDHLDEWARHNGRTDQNNRGIGCGRHNRHKHSQHLTARRDGYGKLRVQRSDGTWICPAGVDPPTEDDFLTDADIDQLARQRLHDLCTANRG